MDTCFEELLSWYHHSFSEDYFESAAGHKIRYARQHGEAARGVAVILPGRTECIEKYIEVCHDLRACGFSFCIIDHFGQGGSDRALADPEKGHVDDFKLYVADLHHLLTSLLNVSSQQKLVLLTHSMGSTIAALLAAEYPHLPDAMLLVSPMFQITTGLFLPPFFVEALARGVCLLGGKNRYVWGGGPFNPQLEFAANELTGDRLRFTRNLRFSARHRDKAVGSPTFGWLQAAYRAMRQVRRHKRELMCPTLILQAAHDVVVDLEAMERFCRANRLCELIRYPEACHELLMERDQIRDRVIAAIRSFLMSLS